MIASILAVFMKIMPGRRRLFHLPAFYLVFDEKIFTEIETEGDAEAASYRQLVVAKIGVRCMSGVMESKKDMS